MKKKSLISAIVVAVIAIAVIILVFMPNKENTEVVNLTPSPTSGNTEKSIETSKDKATFMYFITKEDKGKELSKTLDRLKEEYKDTVTFDIRNVDEDKELLKNFPVEGNTPALIMMKANGDIVNMLFKTAEYDKLKQVIDTAL